MPPIILKRGRFVIQRHNALRNLEPQPLSAVYSDFEDEPVPQDMSREQLSRGTNKAQGARLVTLARGFYEHQQSAFSDVRVCPQLLYPVRTKSRNRQYSRRVHDTENETFTSLIFITTEWMSEEFLRYQELIYSKKGNYLRLLYSAVIMGKYPFPKESYNMNQS